MRSGVRSRWAGASALVAVGLHPAPAEAVRPFVTDDARISDRGQFEAEVWSELDLGVERSAGVFNGLAGVSFNDWLQLIAGTGVSADPGGTLAVGNFVVQPKLLIWPAPDDGTPGLAVAAGLTLPTGRGSLAEDALGFYLVAPLTSRLYDDWLLLHLNVGGRGAAHGSEVELRPYAGFGFDVGVAHIDWRLIGEVYAGDPLEAEGPSIAGQWGLRWIAGDHLNLDLTFGAQPALDAAGESTGQAAFWGQLGLRILVDVFTYDGRPGDPQGARGMIEAPWR